ncbi:response regulator [Marinoscillum sp. MHG1-6]|uniref:response regulator n=1 Tax=Marinoscillum sp. MHG1-6 TaxID=2959627 RepID=UPI002157039C|nr:response regulator [Marinoscillum sp. MHG1-6]
MKQKLNCVLLIDDDEATNFLHELLISECEITNKIIKAENGVEALDYLTNKVNGRYPKPDLIFVDINMPLMNGWGFLEEYEKLELTQKGRIVVVMLTTSLNPEDKDKAQEILAIRDYKSKPLTVDMLNEILQTHFKEWL